MQVTKFGLVTKYSSTLFPPSVVNSLSFFLEQQVFVAIISNDTPASRCLRLAFATQTLPVPPSLAHVDSASFTSLGSHAIGLYHASRLIISLSCFGFNMHSGLLYMLLRLTRLDVILLALPMKTLALGSVLRLKLWLMFVQAAICSRSYANSSQKCQASLDTLE